MSGRVGTGRERLSRAVDYGAWLQLAAVASSLVTQVLGWVERGTNGFWVFVTIGWILAIVVITGNLRVHRRARVPPASLPPASRLATVVAVVAVTAASLLIVGRIWETHFRQVEAPRPAPDAIPPPHTETLPSARPMFTSSAAVAFAHGRNQRPRPHPAAIEATGATCCVPKVVQLAVSPRSSYVEQKADVGFRSFVPSETLRTSIKDGKCRPGFNDRVDVARAALVRYAKGAGKESLVPYFDGDHLIDLVRRRPDIAQRLLPSEREWSALSPADHGAILDWVLSCVGNFHPVLQITLDNRQADEIVLTAIDYDIVKAAASRGADSGPILPLGFYRHHLDCRRGQQSVPLVPPFRIAAQQSASLELQMDADSCGKLAVEFSLKTMNGPVPAPPVAIGF